MNHIAGSMCKAVTDGKTFSSLTGDQQLFVRLLVL